MGRKILLAAAVLLALMVTLATPRVNGVSASDQPPAVAEEHRTDANGIGGMFRAIGNFFRGGKKKQPVSKTTEKDARKFESSGVTRVNDAKTPLAPEPLATTTTEDRSQAERIQRARQLLTAGQLNEAIQELSQAAALDPKSGEVHMLLGIAYDRKGLGARAREAFETAAHDPNNQPMHLNNLGFLLYRQGEYNEAIKYLKRAAKQSPEDARIWNNLVLAQLALDKFDDAYKSSVHSLGEFDSRLKIAERQQVRGRAKDAIKQLEKARLIRPDSIEVHSRLAALYASNGQEEKAQIARQAVAALRDVATTVAPK